MNNNIKQTEKSEDEAPLLGSWNKLYGVVALSLAIMVLLFYIFTKAFE
jgi:hypothetical protein